MRLGVTLPTFTADAFAAIEAARSAEAAGLDGVFAFDHLWPLGHPERPSLSMYPVLGAVAAATTRVHVGTLVARVGLLPDAVVLASLEGLRAIAGDRLIVGLGTGDEASAPEHVRNGIPFLGRVSRLESLAAIAERLSHQDIACWVGAGASETNEVARRSGAALNLWDVGPEVVAETVSRLGTPVTWGGPFTGGPQDAAERLVALAAAGAGWVVWAWPSSLEVVVEAASLARSSLD